jgi:hypothetical protein
MPSPHDSTDSHIYVDQRPPVRPCPPVRPPPPDRVHTSIMPPVGVRLRRPARLPVRPPQPVRPPVYPPPVARLPVRLPLPVRPPVCPPTPVSPYSDSTSTNVRSPTRRVRRRIVYGITQCVRRRIVYRNIAHH